MATSFDRKLESQGISRRDFFKLAGASVVAAAAGPVLTGCAPNPVTGQSELMLMSEQQEIALDKENSPHQFSADYGAVQDGRLNNYIGQVGTKITRISHRPNMPYSFRGVNATYVNAYAFPGGSIAVTRGMLLELENEAELASLLGHEIGHVNYRHTAARMSQGVLMSAILAGATAYASSQGGNAAPVIQTLGGIGLGALLAHYSREDEREADAYGTEYSVRSGYSPQGTVGLMGILKEKSKSDPTVIERMFASHPMSSERYNTAVHAANTTYAPMNGLPVFRERYMDYTVRLRKDSGAIKTLQKGEVALTKGQPGPATRHLSEGLRRLPNDYAGLCMMANAQTQLENYRSAVSYADHAKQVYPQEAQAYHFSGVSRLMAGQYSRAYRDFDIYQNLLPGNPQTDFNKGLCLDAMGNHKEAAQQYVRYLRQNNQGAQAKFAYQRLVGLGYIRQ